MFYQLSYVSSVVLCAIVLGLINKAYSHLSFWYFVLGHVFLECHDNWDQTIDKMRYALNHFLRLVVIIISLSGGFNFQNAIIIFMVEEHFSSFLICCF